MGELPLWIIPGKTVLYDSDKVVNSCIYDYLRSQKLSGSLIIAEFLSLFTHFSTKLLRTSPILLYEILVYPRLHSISSNFSNSLPIPIYTRRERGALLELTSSQKNTVL